MKEVKFYFEDERTYTTIASYIDCLDNFNNKLIYDYNMFDHSHVNEYNTRAEYDNDEYEIYLYAEDSIIDAVYSQIKLLETLKQ